eukprot:139930-Amphidinium_carterae.1
MAGVAMGELILQLWCEFTNALWSPSWQRQRLGCWEQGVMMSPQGSIIARNTSSDTLKERVVVTDAKSLFDGLKRDARGKEPRVGLAVAELKQGMSLMGLTVRWIPHGVMLADAFTKPDTKGNLAPLMHVLRHGWFQLTNEVLHLADRKKDREEGKTTGRSKRKDAE